MQYSSQIARMLHDEHVRTIGVLERIEGVLSRYGLKNAPDAATPEVASALEDLIGTVEGEIGGHFRFEEESLFPLMAASGDASLSELLVEEHATILPLAQEVCALARSGRSDGFTAQPWREFFQKSQELAERMLAHIQKEEMGVLPLLDDLLDPEAESELAMQYAMGR